MEPTVRSHYIPELDAIRALAFSLVVVVHYVVPTWNPALQNHGFIISTVLQAIITCGWFGVPIFLFVSGYSLANGKTAPNTTIDPKLFYLNRFLRIYPLYLVCLTILAFTHKLPGMTVLSIALMQTQDIPIPSAFALLWSIQLEVMCYLLFPIYLLAVIKRDRQQILYFVLALILFRVLLYYLQASMMWVMVYNTMFGGAAIFLFGMLAASMKNIESRALALTMSVGGGFLLIVLATIVFRMGGYQTSTGYAATAFWMFFPEMISVAIFLLLKGSISFSASKPQRNSTVLARLTFHIGRVSYSGYVFHLFILDFWGHAIAHHFDKDSLTILCLSFIGYYSVVVAFSHITYNAIELPFLRFRRVYQK